MVTRCFAISQSLRTIATSSLLTSWAFALPQGAPTTSFQAANPIRANDAAIELGSHATTRCFDWDADGDLDLLVGGGDGRIWLFRNRSDRGVARYAGGEVVSAGERKQWGNSYTGVVLHDLTGDGLPELVVAHSARNITIHPNTGSLGKPGFASAGQELIVQDSCQGRFDIADWDGDGLADLITGSFGGKLEWHKNTGTKRAPEFAAGQPFCDMQLAYNAQPRIVDFDQDGALDLLLGVNWGSVTLYRNVGSPGKPALAAGQPLCWSADGKALSLRDQNGDDTTPELADLNGDSVLDLISGGKNGKLFVMHGVGAADRIAQLQRVFGAAGDDLPSYFETHESERKSAFGALAALQADLGSGLIHGAARERLFQQLATLAKRYPSLLRRRQHDLNAAPHAPMLAAQFWVVVKAALADTPTNRRRVADALAFEGGYRSLLVDLGVIFYDNNRATERQLQCMHQLLMALPRSSWDVELISVADWLGKGREEHPVRARTAVNIFGMNLGVPENSFPADAPRPGITDVYLICLAHEIAHNMLDTVGRRIRPELFERKFEGLAFAAGSDVVYRSPKSAGIDFEQTKANFRANGAWDGNDDHWRDAWKDYFAGKQKFDRAYARGNVQFFLDAPQEAFSTLANQYVADSELMLEFAKVRWDAGHRSTVHQYLLIADYLSGGGNTVPIYVLPRGGALTVGKATLTRDAMGRIKTVRSQTASASFKYQDDATAIVATFRYQQRNR